MIQVPPILAVLTKVWPAVAPVIWLYSLCHWLVTMLYVVPAAGATKEDVGYWDVFVQPGGAHDSQRQRTVVLVEFVVQLYWFTSTRTFPV